MKPVKNEKIDAMAMYIIRDDKIPPKNSMDLDLALRATTLIVAKIQREIRRALMTMLGSISAAIIQRGLMIIPSSAPIPRRQNSLV